MKSVVTVLAGTLAIALALDVVGLSAVLTWMLLPGAVMLAL